MWAINGRWILPEMPDFHVAFRNLLHDVNLRHGTEGFTSPPKKGVLRIFSPWKNPTASAGFEPANLGTKGQHATSRPPKPLCFTGLYRQKFKLDCVTKTSDDAVYRTRGDRTGGVRAAVKVVVCLYSWTSSVNIYGRAKLGILLLYSSHR